MNRSRFITDCCVGATIATLILSPIVLAPPPPVIEIPPAYPGTIIASASSRWIAPYVLMQSIDMSGRQSKRVIWLSKDYDVIKEINGSHISSSSGTVIEYQGGNTVVHSTRDTSSIVLFPRGRDRVCALHGLRLGDYLFQECSGCNCKYTVIYIRGRMVGSYGPHYKTSGGILAMSESGSLAYTLADSMQASGFKIVSVDSLGREVFRFDTEGDIVGITPSPLGDLVVITYYHEGAESKGAYELACHFATGAITKVSPWREGRRIAWLPSTHKMILSSSAGGVSSYQLFDCESGKTLWSVADPLEYTPMTGPHGVAVSQDYFMLSGLAIRSSISHGPVIPNDLRGTILMLAAIDVNDGRLAAKWYEPTFSGKWKTGTGMPPMPNRGGELVWYEGGLYHVTDANFSKISFDDIRNLKNGWVGPTDSGTVYNTISR